MIDRKTLLLCSAVLPFLLGACQPEQAAPKPAVETEKTDQAVVQETAPAPESAATINPQNWPKQEPVMPRDPVVEERIADLISRMTLEEKVGQVLQADIASITPEEVGEYNLGSVLNGGGSAPDGDLRNTPDSWLALADEFWEASTDTSDGGLGIPIIWGTDAVHGHSNVVGATIFPHNIGLGAANDPDLMYEIGRVTSLEMLATGLDWTFAPTVAVVRNDRWGRTYEGYSEDPRIVAAYAPRIVEGIQGKLGTDEFLDESRMIATAKHFVGDGGTQDGIDQGDHRGTEAELRDIHAAGYPPAIAAGAQTVMASYNSFHGKKMHGSKVMLTDVLVDRMGFDGFVIGDWNGHGQVKGCKNTSCPQSFNAGLDMFMVPGDWKKLYKNTLEQVKNGTITQERLEQAVARILRVKIRAGVLDAPRPSERRHAGDWNLLAAPEHRAIAREAVRKSLVLLKNEGGVLPLSPTSTVLVAGDGAHDIGKQSGGWTLSWQGTGNEREHFPNGESIYEGIAAAMSAAGGKAILSEDGNWDKKPDTAVVVFGEDPYAETQGDRRNVDFDPNDGIKLLKRFQAEGIPTVAVFITGRPLWTNPEINASDAFVVAWLPGTEGGGIADVIVADPAGQPRNDFSGRLSFSWPATAIQTETNVGDDDYNPQFKYGYGLAYASPGAVLPLPESSGLEGQTHGSGSLIEYGDPVGSWRMVLYDSGGHAYITDARGVSREGGLTVVPADHQIQEDTFILTWDGNGRMLIDGPRANLLDIAGEAAAMELAYRVISSEASEFMLGIGEGVLEMTGEVAELAGKGWQTSRIPLSCFAEAGADLAAVTEPLVVEATGSLELQIKSVRIVAAAGGEECKR